MQESQAPNNPAVRAGSAEHPAVYRVPPRFGLGEFLALVIIAAVSFALLKLVDASELTYAAVGSLLFVIAVIQALSPQAPRSASALAGGVVTAFWGGVLSLSAERTRSPWLVTFVVFGACLGVVFGYLLGALLAGVFLLKDLFSPAGSLRAVPKAILHELQQSLSVHHTSTAALWPEDNFVDHPDADALQPHRYACTCLLYLSRHGAHGYVVRFATLDYRPFFGNTPRAAIQAAILHFRALVYRCRLEKRAIPWREKPLSKCEDELEQWVPVYF